MPCDHSPLGNDSFVFSWAVGEDDEGALSLIVALRCARCGDLVRFGDPEKPGKCPILWHAVDGRSVALAIYSPRASAETTTH